MDGLVRLRATTEGVRLNSDIGLQSIAGLCGLQTIGFGLRRIHPTNDSMCCEAAQAVVNRLPSPGLQVYSCASTAPCTAQNNFTCQCSSLSTCSGKLSSS